jgi:hypothetical protein
MVKNKTVIIIITLECIDCAQDCERKKKFLDIPLKKIVIIRHLIGTEKILPLLW